MSIEVVETFFLEFLKNNLFNSFNPIIKFEYIFINVPRVVDIRVFSRCLEAIYNGKLRCWIATAKVSIFFKDRESHRSVWRQCRPRSLDVDQIWYLETKRRIDTSLQYFGMKSFLVTILLFQLYLPNICVNNCLNILDVTSADILYRLMCFIRDLVFFFSITSLLDKTRDE